MRGKTLRVGVAIAVMCAATMFGLVNPADAKGAVQISGVGQLAEVGVAPCDDAAHLAADYALALTGDLEGCIYGVVTDFRYHEGSGTYQEVADEVFVGTWDGKSGTWEMTEFFTAKFDTETGAQIWGRCQHPIVAGSGTGDFAGITGRLDFKDDVDAGVAYYRGHLKL